MSGALFFDTNVWMDFFFDRSPRHGLAARLIAAAQAGDVPLYTAMTSTKDIYYLVKSELKRIAREEGSGLGPEEVAAIDEVGWACVRSMVSHATVIPLGEGDIWESLLLRAKHGDYEDDLVLAAALKSKAAWLVTQDSALTRHAPLPCLTEAEALDMLLADTCKGE